MNNEPKIRRVHLELQRVQTSLFAVPRLRAMVGANALLGETLRAALPKLARETGRWVLEGHWTRLVSPAGVMGELHAHRDGAAASEVTLGRPRIRALRGEVHDLVYSALSW